MRSFGPMLLTGVTLVLVACVATPSRRTSWPTYVPMVPSAAPVAAAAATIAPRPRGTSPAIVRPSFQPSPSKMTPGLLVDQDDMPLNALVLSNSSLRDPRDLALHASDFEAFERYGLIASLSHFFVGYPDIAPHVSVFAVIYTDPAGARWAIEENVVRTFNEDDGVRELPLDERIGDEARLFIWTDPLWEHQVAAVFFRVGGISAGVQAQGSELTAPVDVALEVARRQVRKLEAHRGAFSWSER